MSTHQTPAPMQLASPSELGKQFGVTGQLVGQILTNANIEPAYRRGKNAVLYHHSTAAAAIEKELAARAAAKGQAPTAAIATLDVLYLASEISDMCKSEFSDLFCDLLEEIKELDAMSKERDRQLFKAVEALHALVSQRLTPDSAPRSPEPQAGKVPTPETPAPAAPPAAPKPSMPVVLVVGLPNAQHAAIRKEFTSCLTIDFAASEDVRAQSFDARVDRADVIVVMSAFCNHGLDKITRRKDKDIRTLRGGTSGLRGALTEIFVAKS